MRNFRSFAGSLWCLFLCVIPVLLSAQQEQTPYARQTDSLLNLLNTAQDTQLATVYYRLAANRGVSDEDAEVYAEECLQLSDSIAFDFGKIRALYILGHLEYGKANYKAAIEYYKKGLRIAEDVSIPEDVLKGLNYLPNAFFYMNELDSALVYNRTYRQKTIEWNDKAGTGLSWVREGDFYSQQFLMRLAINSYLSSLDIFKQINDSINLANTYASLGMSLERSDEDEDAIIYYKSALALFPKINDPYAHLNTLVNMNLLYKKQGKLDSARYLLLEAFELLRGKREDYFVNTHGKSVYHVGINVNLASLYAREGNYQQALDTLDSIEKNYRDYFSQGFQASADRTRAEIYLGQEEIAKAREFAQLALKSYQQSGTQDEEISTLELLIRIEEANQNYPKAFELQKSYQSLKDTLTETIKRRTYKELLLQYEGESRERRIVELEKENLKEANQRNILIASLLILGVLGVSLVGFFRARNRRNKALLEQGRELDRMKSRFFTQLSHELRTPLTLIIGPLTQLLEMDISKSEGKKLNLMQRNAQRLLQLVNQVLDLSKLQAGKLELRAAPVELGPLLRLIHTSFDSKAEVKQLDYQLFLPEEAVELYLDEEKFHQIIGNLLSNGCKFVQEEGKLWLRLQNLANTVRITVEDTGPGLSPLQQRHIFDPYYQATSNNQQDEAGTGIGLALVKELVELHGGKIEVESEVGKGTTFNLEFKKGRAHLKDQQLNFFHSGGTQEPGLEVEPSSLQEGNNTEEAWLSERPTILIAEDVPDMQEYLKSILIGKFNLLMAPNGDEALTLAREQMPDMIIADIMMPKKDGMTFLRELKQDNHVEHIPLVFLSAKSGMDTRLEGWEHQAHAFLTKPFHPRELLLVIDSVLKHIERMQVRFQGEVILKPSEVAVNSQEAAFLNQLTTYLEENLDDTELSIEKLASEMAMSRSQLNRKLKALTGQNPSIFIRNFRLQRARQLLEAGYGNISEVSDAVGISSAAYFSRIFSEAFGSPPSAWTKKK